MFHISSPNGSHPTSSSICSICSLIHLQKNLSGTVEKLWLQGTFNLYPRPDTIFFFIVVLYFPLLSVFWCSVASASSLWCRSLAVGLVSMSQLHAHFLWLTPSLPPLLLLSAHFPGKSQFYSATKSSAYRLLFKNFSRNAGWQSHDPSQPIELKLPFR